MIDFIMLIDGTPRIVDVTADTHVSMTAPGILNPVAIVHVFVNQLPGFARILVNLIVILYVYMVLAGIVRPVQK